MRRVPTVLAVLMLALGFGAAVAGPAQAASSLRYVALGDSYSAGVGAGSYSGGACMRSANAYSVLWNAKHKPSSFTFAACSGATTDSVRAFQVPSVTTSTTLVTLTVGGNDIGFAKVMRDCLTPGGKSCATAVSEANEKIKKDLPKKLDYTLSDIHRRSKAKIIMMNYPRLYNAGASFCPGLSKSNRAKINGAADNLANAIRDAAKRGKATYQDVRDEFAGHAICDDEPWLNQFKLTDKDNPAAYHPTATGQKKGYFAALQKST